MNVIFANKSRRKRCGKVCKWLVMPVFTASIATLCDAKLVDFTEIFRVRPAKIEDLSVEAPFSYKKEVKYHG